MRTARIASGLAALTLAGGLGVAGASSASADQRHNDERGRDNRGQCSLDATKRGDNLRVQVRSNTGDGFAIVRANFNQGRDDTNRVDLNRRGDGTTRFDIPRRADWVDVTAYIRDRDRGFVTCSDRVRV